MPAEPVCSCRALCASLALAALMAIACGRVGYDPIASVAPSRGGAGGVGAGGLGGTGGGAGGSVGGGASARGGAGGMGGSGGTTGAGGTAGAAGAGGSGGTGGAAGAAGAAGMDGGAGISCATAMFGGHDYLFCDALVDWATARAECEGRGMRLVRIDDASEDNWLQITVSFSASMFRRESLWLGGYEPTTDGDWHWTDGDAFWLGGAAGTSVGGLFTNWESGEPNNAVGPESCLAMPLNKTTWFDWQCSDSNYFACELY